MRVPRLPFMGTNNQNVGSDSDLITVLEANYRTGLEARRPFERGVLMAFLFWAGDQWTEVEADIVHGWGRRLTAPSRGVKTRIINNRLASFARSIASTIMSNQPRIEGVAATLQPEDIEAAKLATRMLKWRNRQDREEDLQLDDLLWVFGAGEHLRLTWFDPAGGRPGSGEGDITTESVNFFNYVKDPYSPASMWPPRWMIHSDAWDVDAVQEIYGKKVEPEDVADQTRYLDRLAMSVMGGRDGALDRKDGQAVVLKRMYARPCEEYPEGHCWVWAGQTLLHEHDLQAGQVPFERLRWYHIPTRMYPLSFIEPLISDQKRLNTILSQWQEVVTRQLRGDSLVTGSGEPMVEESEDGARIVRVPAGTTLDWIKYDLRMQDAQMMIEMLFDDMQDKTARNEPSLGQAPPQAVTATQIAILRDADFGNLMYHMHYLEEYQLAIARQKLALAGEYYRNERVMDTVGARPGEPVAFFGADLRGTRDVVAIPVPAMTPAMRLQRQLEAAQANLLPPWESIDHQVTSRLQLRWMGLEELEEELAADYGPLEDLMVRAGQLQQIRDKMEEMETALEWMLAMGGMGMGAPALPGGPAGAGPAPAAPSPPAVMQPGPAYQPSAAEMEQELVSRASMMGEGPGGAMVRPVEG